MNAPKMRKKTTNALKMRRTYSVRKSELKMLTILKGKFWSIIRAIGSKFAEKKEPIDILTKAIKRFVPVSYWEDLLSLFQIRRFIQHWIPLGITMSKALMVSTLLFMRTGNLSVGTSFKQLVFFFKTDLKQLVITLKMH